MNAVEIEEAISALAEQPFDPAEFPYAFLLAFGAKETTLKRLRSGATNRSDIGGILKTNDIHIKVCDEGKTGNTLSELKASSATNAKRNRVKFILATDGNELHAEDLNSGDVVVCDYADFPDHFGFFLPLAGISTVKQIRESAFDIKATGRLNRLYVELLKDNPDWGTADRRPEMNHFMARLIFCFFAEDTDILSGDDLFTATIEQMSARDSSNTHEVIGELFRAMNTKLEDRAKTKIPRWANTFPYVNGGLFGGSQEAKSKQAERPGNQYDVPQFSRIARSYLLHIGKLDWKKINPDIFGSMIQAVADDEERGSLGMHYTSVPNILKVLSPLFLDDLREKLEAAGDNARKLINLRNRMAKIRVFDPACGSGNFLVIAYKEMRAIEAEINRRRGEAEQRSEIPLTNFRGIEIRDFPAEIARLALIIAEYQCDVLYRGQKEALVEFLPLDAQNWITCGNALRLDWLSICPPTGAGVKHHAEDLFQSTLEQAQIDFENEGGETYICGNPPYSGSTKQSASQKADLGIIFDGRVKSWRSLDYVAGWFMKAADYSRQTSTVTAFVTTNSICQGQQVPILWPNLFRDGHQISFAHTSFKWANLASHNAGVTVAIVAITNRRGQAKRLFSPDEFGGSVQREATNINAYLAIGENVVVEKMSRRADDLPLMTFGNKPVDDRKLRFSSAEKADIVSAYPSSNSLFRRIVGTSDFLDGTTASCLWVTEKNLNRALEVPEFAERIQAVREHRMKSRDAGARKMSDHPHQFREMREAKQHTVVIPRITSEKREFLPVGLLDNTGVISSQCFGMYDAPIWVAAIVMSRAHLSWVHALCGRLELRLMYSNTICWNTFPVPTLTYKNKTDLARCAEEILLVREAHFPATIADLYDPEKMPEELRTAHERNDDVLERIYIGRRFRNDTERLEKLFELYTKMVAAKDSAKGAA